jgi:predicted DNA-binding transcriptional regulator YafY
VRRPDRLSEIIRLLGCASGPLTAGSIASELGISRRTVYRDIAELIVQCVPILRGAEMGYVLERGSDLLPLRLTLDEIEAVVLGSQWVKAHAEPALARATMDAVAKIACALPERLRDAIDDPAVGTPPALSGHGDSGINVARLRLWSRQERKLVIVYVDRTGVASERTVWPFLVGYSATSRILMAWCELRQDFRMFRTDRLAAVEFLDQHYPEHRAKLRSCWLTLMEEAHAKSDPARYTARYPGGQSSASASAGCSRRRS